MLQQHGAAARSHGHCHSAAEDPATASAAAEDPATGATAADQAAAAAAEDQAAPCGSDMAGSQGEGVGTKWSQCGGGLEAKPNPAEGRSIACARQGGCLQRTQGLLPASYLSLDSGVGSRE